MAKRVKWADRIGETKEVQGITFTIVGNDGDTVIVEAGDDLHFMSRATWRNGKFTKILRVLKPKYLELVGVKAKVNGILFTVLEAAKEYVRIKAEGYEGEEIITTGRWKRAKFATKKFMSNFTLILSKCRDLVITSLCYLKRKTNFSSELEQDVYNLEHTTSLKELRKFWAKISKKYHPDLGGNKEDFKIIHSVYKEYRRDLELIEETMAAFGL